MSEWKIKKLSDIATVIDSLHKTPSYVAEGFPMVRVTDIKGGYLDLKETFKVSESVYRDFSKKHIPKRGDLVFSRVGTYGCVSFVKDDTPFCLGQNTVFIIPDVDPYFLFYFLNSSIGQYQINSFATGSTQKTISLANIKNIKVPLPSAQEQKRIAAVLSCLDDKIENLRKQNETLEKIAQTLFKHWFIDFEFPNENGQPYRSSGGAMQPSELGAIPAGWRVGKLGDLTKISTGKGLKKHEFNPSGMYPVLGANGEMGRTDKFLTAGQSILTGRVGTLGIVNINYRKAWISDNVIIFNPENLLFYYIYFCLKNTDLKKLNRGSTQPLITQGDLKQIQILMPIEKYFLSFNFFCQTLLEKQNFNTQQIQTLTKTRDRLLPELMSGKLRVPE